MTDATKAEEKRAREKRWNEIEHKHEARCLWQQAVGNRTILVECLDFPRIKAPLLIAKHFDTPIPRPGSSKPWPEMIACYVFAPIGGNTWESLDDALTGMSQSDAA